MALAKSIAIVGAGPAGVITIDALAQEKAFDTIKVFERRESAGGCWLQDPPDHIQELPDLSKIANRNPDTTHPIPPQLPTKTPKSKQYRFSETSIYPYLETNIDAGAMSFSQEPIPEIRSEISIQRHGSDTPFRHWKVIEKYISEDLLKRNGYQDLVVFNTTVELVEKVEELGKWRLVLRREESGEDFWWYEDFDAVIIASGHYTVPFIPHIEGLAEFATAYPGSVEHSKAYRGRQNYAGKRVVVLGASISGPDICSDLCGVAQTPIIASIKSDSQYHPYFGDYAFQNPHIQRRLAISRVDSTNGARTVYFTDGSFVEDVDNIIFGTGYTWTLHMLPDVEIRNNRVPGLYQHIFSMRDPTLLFVGAVAAGFTFKVFEWQAVLAARFLAGRYKLPPLAEQVKWEEERIEARGDGVRFTALYPEFEEYFEEIRALAGEPVEVEGKGVCGRRLPRFEKRWVEGFERAHLKRIEMWKKRNREDEEKLRIAGENGEVPGAF